MLRIRHAWSASRPVRPARPWVGNPYKPYAARTIQGRETGNPPFTRRPPSFCPDDDSRRSPVPPPLNPRHITRRTSPFHGRAPVHGVSQHSAPPEGPPRRNHPCGRTV
ncbi:hypothetical protein STVIR_6152 [Streptomyces viridochromogenes Tue57]|uniref:Uncharacterized protein n=1 Tax=Streptomyces viridochromogenes Tue57 TaxID=1160705 RepID=L8PC96_STRVR|nr:hypothetical protein STVIR_6152 [Streptomyces viridochromogenes Tue57]